MVLVRLKGTPQTQWNIGGSFLPGGSPIDLSEDLVVAYKQIVEEVVDKKFEHLLFKESKIENKITKLLKTYSEDELFALDKDQQVQLLITLGVKDAIKLKKESDRVKAILGAQI